MKKSNLLFLNTLPVSPAEKVEITKALERRCSIYWVKAREELKELCDSRLAEKREKKLQALLTEDKINQLVPVDDITLIYIEELWTMGYSSAAISKALKYAVSGATISQKMEPVKVRKRGQVIELLEDFEVEFNLDLWRLKTTGAYRQGPKITDREKELFRKLKSQGYSTSYIASVTGRSENAVRKWVK